MNGIPFLMILMYLCSTLMHAQTDEITSFFLSKVPQQNAKWLRSIPNKYNGEYILESDSSQRIKLYKDSIVITNLIAFSVTEDEVKSHPNWFTQNGKIYGIHKHKSLPYIQSNDTLFAVLELNYPIWSSSDKVVNTRYTQNILTVFNQTDQFWTFYKIQLDSTQVIISRFNHDKVLPEILSWKTLTTTTINGYKTYIGTPTKEEFQTLLSNALAYDDHKTFNLRSISK